MQYMLQMEYAPEHLVIMTKDDESTLSQINNAGSIFLGKYSPVACGDYGSGTNRITSNRWRS